MQIHIARKGAQLGVFTSEEVRAGLATGRFITTDLAWREGMAEWSPASQVPGLPAGCLGAAVPPPPGPAASPLPPVMPASGSPSVGDAAISLLVPVGVDGFAMASGYLAFLAPLMFVALLPGLGELRIVFPLPGLLGCALGLIALRRLKRNPSARGKVRAWMGVALPAAVFALMLVAVFAGGLRLGDS